MGRRVSRIMLFFVRLNFLYREILHSPLSPDQIARKVLQLIVYQQLRNEAGRAMTPQGADITSMFQFENDVLTLVPRGTQWSDSDMPHTEITTRSGAVGKFSWGGN
jgi:hypothetical protein